MLKRKQGTLLRGIFTIVLVALLASAYAACRTRSGLSIERSDLNEIVGFRAGDIAQTSFSHNRTVEFCIAKSDESSPPHKPSGPLERVPWTDFMETAANGDDKTLLRALDAGEDPNAKSNNGWTPLMWASDGGHRNTAKILIDHGADLERTDKKGSTALMLAVMRSRNGIIDLLLERGASPNAADKKGLTPLMIAASEGDSSAVRKLLDAGAKVDARDKSGRTALMWASNVPIADLLVKRGANVHARTRDGKTPLMAAAQRHDDQLILVLLRHGADLLTKDKEGRTALDWGYYYNYGSIEDHHYLLEILSYHPDEPTLCKAAILGREDMAADLIRAGVKPDDMEKCEADEEFAQSTTPLFWAVREGQVGIVRQLLDRGALDVESGTDLLNSAAYNGHKDVLKLLLEHGALEKTDKKPEYWEDVCKKNDKEIIRLLRNYDTKICKQDAKKAQPKDCWDVIKGYAGERSSSYTVWRGSIPRFVQSAAREGNVYVLKCLLKAAKELSIHDSYLKDAVVSAARSDQVVTIALLNKHGIDANHPDKDGVTPLMWASINGNSRMVRALLALGAKIHSRSKAGWTPVMYAQAFGHRQIVKMLKARGARNDETLAGASAAGDTASVKRLLRSSADINARDRVGWSPLLWACATGQANVVELLLRHGALSGLRGESRYSYPHWYLGDFTPLEMASHHGHVDVVRILLQNRKRTKDSSGDKNGTTSGTMDDEMAESLNLAFDKGHFPVVKALVDQGADVNAINSDSGDIKGSEALLKAARSGLRDMVELLLAHGADPNTYEEPQGDSYYAPTPLDEATRRGYERIRQLLLRYGADNHRQELPWGE